MRGAAMTLIASAGGFVVFLLSMSAAQGQNDWEVTYTSTKICALKGSTVDINCTYSSRVNGHERTFWFTKSGNYEFADLRTELEYAGRVQYHFDENNYTLRITDLKESDSAEYKLITNQPGERLTGSPGVTLSVTDLQVQVIRSYYVTTLKCNSSCHLDSFSSYIWYKNGWEISRETSSYYKVYRPDFNPADSYSCAVKGHEDFPSPLVCVFGQSCNKVTYTDRSICAFRGSSVDISCTYTSCESNIKSTLWFCPERSRQWLNPSQPEDLSKDSQYAGRVQLLKTKGGSSILRISDLRENDSAQYRFTFQTQSSKWRSTLPGTTLTVTAYPALWVQVTTIKYHPSYTEAELKCLSGCVLPCCDSYIWFKNGQKIKKEETALYSGQFVTGDKISCALKGYENYSSPLYAPQLTSVSVSPSGEIIEGSTVTLICRGNASTEANYTWYKENEDSPIASGQNFTITDIRREHSGNYYCETQSRRGLNTATLYLTVVAGKSVIIMNTIRLILVVLMLIPLLLLSLWIRKKKPLSSTTELNEPVETIELNSGPDYTNASAFNTTEEQEDLE